MPKDEIEFIWNEYKKDINKVVKTFGVSKQAAIFRLEKLGLISKCT